MLLHIFQKGKTKKITIVSLLLVITLVVITTSLNKTYANKEAYLNRPIIFSKLSPNITSPVITVINPLNGDVVT